MHDVRVGTVTEQNGEQIGKDHRNGHRPEPYPLCGLFANDYIKFVNAGVWTQGELVILCLTQIQQHHHPELGDDAGQRAMKPMIVATDTWQRHALELGS